MSGGCGTLKPLSLGSAPLARHAAPLTKLCCVAARFEDGQTFVLVVDDGGRMRRGNNVGEQMRREVKVGTCVDPTFFPSCFPERCAFTLHPFQIRCRRQEVKLSVSV